MNWGDFVDAVNDHLPVESRRRGADAFRTRHMQNAAIDLQRYIAAYRNKNVTTYTADQVNLMTRASLGELPAGAKPKAFYLVCGFGTEGLPATDSSVTTWDELAELATITRPVGSLLSWVEAATGLLQVVQLRDSTEATDQSSGIQRPDDYAASTNEKVWFKTN